MAGIWGLCVTVCAGEAQAQQRDPTTTHQRMLRAPIADALFQRSTDEIFGVVGLGVSGLGIYAASHLWERQPVNAATWTVGFGALEVAGLGSVLLPRDDRSRVLKLVGETWPAVFYAVLAVGDDTHPFGKLPMISLAAGYTGSAILRSIDSFNTATRFSTLENDLSRLDDGRLLSSAERSRMHRDLIGARGPVGRWARGMPLIIGGAISVTQAFDEQEQGDTRRLSAFLGSVALLDGLLTTYVKEPVDAYEDELERLHVEVALGPGRLQLSGWFKAL